MLHIIRIRFSSVCTFKDFRTHVLYTHRGFIAHFSAFLHTHVHLYVCSLRKLFCVHAYFLFPLFFYIRCSVLIMHMLMLMHVALEQWPTLLYSSTFLYHHLWLRILFPPYNNSKIKWVNAFVLVLLFACGYVQQPVAITTNWACGRSAVEHYAECIFMVMTPHPYLPEVWSTV